MPLSKRPYLHRELAFCYGVGAMAFRLRKRFLALLLPVVLAFAQHSAMAHLVSHHGDKPADPGQALVHLKLCDKCVTAAKLIHLPAGQELRVELLHARCFHSAAVPTPFASAEWTAHACRDPPSSL